MSAPDLTPQQKSAIDQMYDAIEEGTFYDLLRVAPDAKPNDIQKAYYNLSRQWHPDRFFRKDIGEYAERLEMVFVGITQAYQTLKSPEKRKTYDRELREAGRVPRSGSRPAPAVKASAPPDATPGPAPEAPDAPERPAASPARAPATRPGSIRERLEARRKASGTATRPSRMRSVAEAQVREQLKTQLTKARVFFEQGKADYQAGRVIKAAGALELAVQFDPRNEEYRALLEVAKIEARTARVQQLMLQGEQAESYQQYKQAIQKYREAVELEPDEGIVYYRLARLVKHEEEDVRQALNLFRDAVVRDPDVIDFRMALGELYAELGLKLNAKREFNEVLKRDKGHEGAKAGLKNL